MYQKWVKVCEINKSLKNKIVELGDENEMFKGASANWRDLLKLKDEKIQELKAELENTQKNLRMLNSGTQNLDQILSMGKSVSDRNGLGYTDVT